MSMYEENELEVQQDDYVDIDVETGDGCEKAGLTTGQTIALVGLAGLGTAWVIEKAVKFGKWIRRKVEEHRANKALNQPEEGKTVEPTDDQILEAAGK